MSTWPDEKIARLKELAALGWTYSHIAFDLGMTRNACIAKASRLKLDNGGPKYGAGVPMPKPVIIPKIEPEPIGPVRAFPDRGCRFIRDDIAPGVEWRCCGHPIARPGISWCPWHLRAVFQAAPRAREAA